MRTTHRLPRPEKCRDKGTLIQRAAHVKVRRSRRCVTCADRKWRRTLREVSAQGPVQLPLTRLLRARLQVFLCVGVLDHPRTSR